MSLIAAAGAVGVMFATTDDESGSMASRSTAPPALSISAPAGAPPPQIQRAGQITAISQESVTTTSADGQITTFRITPNTAYITPTGGSYSAAAVAAEQDVLVVGVVHDGVPIATAIADRNAVGPGGPPMDYQLPT